MNKKIILLIVLIVSILSWNIGVAYVDKQLEKREHDGVYSNCNNIWSARGLYSNKGEQNTVSSLKRAFEAGTLGIEIDFNYDVRTDRFIIGHDHPVKDSSGNFIYTKKNGKLLTMEEILSSVGEGHYFWFDYKNLDKLSVEDSKQAIERLNVISKIYGVKDRIYIEGSNPLRLALYTDAGFKTILGIHPLPESNIFSSITINGFKIGYYLFNITGVALAYGSVEDPVYGEETEHSLRSIPTFLFHVPDDRELLQSLVKKESVRVILAGRDISIVRSDINTCK